MSFFILLLYVCVPLFLGLAVFGIVLKYALRFLFGLARIPNKASASPSSLLVWTRLAPPDILFRLAALAALNLVLYWLPVWYWTTYQSSGDERDGGLLFYSIGFCPISWLLGGLCYAQVWRARFKVRHPAMFCVASSVLVLVVWSTVLPQIRFHIQMSRL